MLVFPTRDGRFYEYENLGIVESLRHKIEAGHLQLYCLDSIGWETFYCWWCNPADRVRRHAAFEEYILNEIMPFMAAKNGHPCTIAHGCSFGAYHAANMAFRHPNLFRKLAAFSGRYDPTLNVDGFRDLLDGHRDENVYYHTPVHYLPGLAGWRLDALRRMDIILVVGRDDPFLDNNRHLSGILWRKGVWHALYEWDERAHQGRYWRKMASLYI